SGDNDCYSPLIYRGTNFTTSPGKSLTLDCPVKECGKTVNVSWSKESGTTQNSQVRDGLRKSRQPDKEKNITIFRLYFNPVFVGDNGSYQCTVILLEGKVYASHRINVYVTSEYRLQSPDIYVTNSTEALLEPKSEKEPWLLYIFLSMGLLCILIITSLSIFFCLRSKREKQKKHPDTLGRGINEVMPHQSFGDNQAEESTICNSTLPSFLPLSSDTIIYNNDAWPKVQVGPTVIYSNQSSEENQPGIVYASLNHSANGVNFLRRGEHMADQPTEYASICVRN
ncbi:B- and T-lymphocyte attenuator, partial [Dromiciops gliroides]|uniref:B- and T-lymphocyte attenuator n=1 Tax=Dromiciops gliroides TaxID=33562 RepID=UPI001CC4E487